MAEVKKGRYRHFKGNEYIVTGIAKHSESLEEFVVYHSTNDSEQIWIRPLKLFLETAEKKVNLLNVLHTLVSNHKTIMRLVIYENKC